jgi:hypothetical protein
MYIGNGVVVGIDIWGACCHGTCILSASIRYGTATLMSAGGALVTRQNVPVPVSFSLSTEFDTASITKESPWVSLSIGSATSHRASHHCRKSGRDRSRQSE